MTRQLGNFPDTSHAIVLFDGECSFCSRSVRFMVKHDPAGYFRFAPRQSAAGQECLKQAGLPDEPGSMILLENGRGYLRTAASWRIARGLNWPWKLGAALAIIPAPLRDALYNAFAKRRHKWFKNSAACPTPTPELAKRFLA